MKLLGRHNEVVSLLLERLDELAEHKDVPSVVVIEGASGTGKTAIIQEFYEQLKEARGDEYWPAQMAADAADVSSEGSPFATRKRVSPNLDNFVWPAGVLPQFGWFGFDCQRLSDGSTYDVISAARPQLRAHMLPLTLARDEKLGRMHKLKKLVGLDTRDIYDAIVDEAEGVLTDAALEALGLVVPGLGLFTSLSKETAKKIKEAKQDKDALRGEVRTGDKNKEDRFVAATELAESICAVAQQSLPVIITIEDIHLMGEELGHFLGRLEENRAWKDLPILVVATAWPEGRKNSTYVEWLAEEVGSQGAEVVLVPEFDLDSRRDLLREYAPGTEEEVLDAIVVKLVTPFAIKLWVTQKKIQRAIRRNDGAIVLSADVSIPDSLKSLIRDRWNELDSDVQQALTFAVAVNPIDNDDTAKFIREVVAQTSGNFDELSEAELIDAFVRAYKPINWCRFEDDLSSFTEPLLAQQARENSNEEFDVEDVRELRERALEVTAEWISDHDVKGIMPQTDANLNAARWFIALNGEPTGETSDDLLRVQIIATATIASELADSYKYSDAIELLQNVLDIPGAEELTHGMWTVRNYLAFWLGSAGRVGEAVEQFERLLEVQRRVLGEDHPDALATRGNFASLLGQAGRVDEAIELCEALLEDQNRVLGEDHPLTLVMRNNLAFFLGDSGRVDEAIEQFEALLKDRRRVLGEDHPDTSLTRNNLAGWLDKAGRRGEAIERFEALLKDQCRVLGEDHPATLGTRHHLAFSLGESGRVDEAIEQFGAVLEGRRRVLGEDHPDTLVARNNLAFHLGRAGRVDEATKQFEALLEDERRVLGEDHPDTLVTRGHLAFLSAEMGHADKAIEQLEGLLEDERRVLGEDHPDTLRTLNNLATSLAETGRVGEAIELLKGLLERRRRVSGENHPDTLAAGKDLAYLLFTEIELAKSLLKDRRRVLGKNHPDTLAARSNLALRLGQAGRLREAIAMYEVLLKVQRRVLGEDHSDTLTTRNNLAVGLVEVGRVDEAVEQFGALLKIQRRVLGEDHPDRLATRNNFAFLLGEVGRVSEAIEQFEALLEDERRVLGEDHPETLDTRNSLAYWLGKAVCAGEAGRVGEAVEQFEALLKVQRRVLGEDHPETLITRNNLALWLGSSGRVGEAIKQFEGLVEDMRRVLGENHPNTLNARNSLAYFRGQVDGGK